MHGSVSKEGGGSGAASAGFDSLFTTFFESLACKHREEVDAAKASTAQAIRSLQSENDTLKDTVQSLREEIRDWERRNVGELDRPQSSGEHLQLENERLHRTIEEMKTKLARVVKENQAMKENFENLRMQAMMKKKAHDAPVSKGDGRVETDDKTKKTPQRSGKLRAQTSDRRHYQIAESPKQSLPQKRMLEGTTGSQPAQKKTSPDGAKAKSPARQPRGSGADSKHVSKDSAADGRPKKEQTVLKMNDKDWTRLGYGRKTEVAGTYEVPETCSHDLEGFRTVRTNHHPRLGKKAETVGATALMDAIGATQPIVQPKATNTAGNTALKVDEKTRDAAEQDCPDETQHASQGTQDSYEAGQKAPSPCEAGWRRRNNLENGTHFEADMEEEGRSDALQSRTMPRGENISFEDDVGDTGIMVSQPRPIQQPEVASPVKPIERVKGAIVSRQVVRNQEERRKLPPNSCIECETWLKKYPGDKLKFCRHRSNVPLVFEPKHLWEADDLGQTPTERAE